MTYEFESGEVALVDIHGLIKNLTDFFSDVRYYVSLVAGIPEIDKDSLFELIRDDLDVEIETQVLYFTSDERTGRQYDRYFFSEDDFRTLITEVVYEMGGDYNLIIEQATEKVMSSINQEPTVFQAI